MMSKNITYNNQMKQIDLSKKGEVTGKIGSNVDKYQTGLTNYSNNIKMNQKQKNSINSGGKYSQNELEEAKNATKGLGLKPSTNQGGKNNDGLGNYRKQFKPQFENSKNSNSQSNVGAFNNIVPNNKIQNEDKNENFVVDKVEKHKQIGGTGNYGKLNFTQKYNTGNNSNNSNQILNNIPFQSKNGVGGGSYTNSKLNKPFTSSSTKTGNSNSHTLKTNKTSSQNNKPQQSNFNNQIEEIDDNRPLNTKR